MPKLERSYKPSSNTRLTRSTKNYFLENPKIEKIILFLKIILVRKYFLHRLGAEFHKYQQETQAYVEQVEDKMHAHQCDRRILITGRSLASAYFHFLQVLPFKSKHSI